MFCPSKTAAKHQWNTAPQSKNSYRCNKLFWFIDGIELCTWRRAILIVEVVFIAGDTLLRIKSDGDLPNTAFLLYRLGSGITRAGGTQEFNFPPIPCSMTGSIRNKTFASGLQFGFPLSLKNLLEGRVGISVGYDWIGVGRSCMRI